MLLNDAKAQLVSELTTLGVPDATTQVDAATTAITDWLAANQVTAAAEVALQTLPEDAPVDAIIDNVLSARLHYSCVALVIGPPT